MQVKIEISAKHIHLTKDDFEKLFGYGQSLTKLRELSQPGEFAAKETLAVEAGEIKFKNIRIVGPVRPYTQVEISTTEARKTGFNVPLRSSGDLAKTPGFTLIGPKGTVECSQGLIIAERHLHLSNNDAEKYNLKTGDQVRLQIGGRRGGILDNVSVKASQKYSTIVHLDTDEANTMGINSENNSGQVII